MKTIYEGRPQNEKLDLLKANCKSTQRQEVRIFFSEDDLAEMMASLSVKSIERKQLEEELKELSKDLRAKIKISTGNINSLLVNLTNKYELQIQDVFEFDDQEAGLMLTYDCKGELISSRRLLPKEKQTRLINLNEKTA